jgi:hypothetical protein
LAASIRPRCGFGEERRQLGPNTLGLAECEVTARLHADQDGAGDAFGRLLGRGEGNCGVILRVDEQCRYA